METFYEKNCQKKTNQEGLRTEKVIRKQQISYIFNGKVMIIHLIVGLIIKTL